MIVLVSRVTAVDLPHLESFLFHYHALDVSHVFLILLHPLTVKDRNALHQIVDSCTPWFRGGVSLFHADHHDQNQNPDDVFRQLLPLIQRQYNLRGQNAWLVSFDSDEFLWLNGRTIPQFLEDKEQHHFKHLFAGISQFQFPWIFVDHLGATPHPQPIDMISKEPWYTFNNFYFIKSMVRLNHDICTPCPHFFHTPPGTYTVVGGHVYIPSDQARSCYDWTQNSHFTMDWATVPVLFHLQTMDLWNIFLKVALHQLRGKSSQDQKDILKRAMANRDIGLLRSLFKVHLCTVSVPRRRTEITIVPKRTDVLTLWPQGVHINARTHMDLVHRAFPDPGSRAFIVDAMQAIITGGVPDTAHS